jgi:hypothetical protein
MPHGLPTLVVSIVCLIAQLGLASSAAATPADSYFCADAGTDTPLDLDQLPDADVTIYHKFLPSPNYTLSDIKASLKIYSGDARALPLTKVEWKDPEGLTARCRPVEGGCVIHNDYSTVGTLLASTHEFNISGEGRLPGTYTAIASYCTSQYGTACIGSWAEIFRDNFYISGTSTTYTISGNATAAGAALSYVDGATKTVTADGTGNYTVTVPSGWSGTVTPAKIGYTFSPVSRSYSNVLSNRTAQDYTATTSVIYRIYLPLALK